MKPLFALPHTFRHSVVAAALFLLGYGYANAITPFTVQDIRIEGLQRTEAGTVFNYFPVRVGDTFNDEKSAAALKALYATGFFKDIRIEAEGDVLVIFVEERPAVSSINFDGIKEFDKEVLVNALKDIGLAEARTFDRALVERAELELKRQYLSRGLYAAKVTTTVTPVERNRVAVLFSVDEGLPARIHQINFVGNKVFSDDDLASEMSLTTPGWMTWLTKTDQYSKQKLNADIETLKSFYKNRGYIEMQVQSTQVSITPDKKDIYITVNLSEGEKYTVSDVTLEGKMFGQQEAIKELVELKKGDIYSDEKMQSSAKKIAEHMGNFGYAFANVNPHPVINREKKEVAFVIFVDPGKRVYVRRVNVAGNTKTRDEVIRREFRQMESSWYDGKKIKQSRNRVDRLGYFSEVGIQTPAVPGSQDQVDVNLTVVEKPTGNIMLGAGYSQSEALMLQGSIFQENFAGTGNTLGLSINTSKRYRTIALSQTNPYFTDDGVSRSYELFLRTTRPPTSYDYDYKVQTVGGNIKFGVPFTEWDRVYFGAGVERVTVETYGEDGDDNASPQKYRDFVEDLGGSNPGSATANSLPLTVSWARDNRDSALVPTEGRFQKAGLILSPVGDLKYYKASYQDQYYWPLTRSITLALNGQIDYGEGFGGKPYPVFKNVYAGGIGTVRGYESSTLGGVTEDDYENAIGGSKRLIANVELQMPLSAAGGSYDRTLRWFTFFDAGYVWEEESTMRLSDLRYSAGIGISWVSPIGPLKLSYGYPINAEEGDKKQQFQFQIGTGF